ncbi:alpha/beta fold hydrolase [Nocardioides insulae]|uniref:alpha/beta fold hydrolase n=1 Tax=Nocardioides insulae TaxID=394734 RepID=UPI0003F99AD9|nr:alpha/beta fold hydrolase [Nocardioides insulae]
MSTRAAGTLIGEAGGPGHDAGGAATTPRHHTIGRHVIALFPRPEAILNAVRAAAGHLTEALVYGGLADLRPMPRTLIDEGPLREVYRYRPGGTTAAHADPVGEPGMDPGVDPVLLVAPVAAPAFCYDLRRGCSLAEHLVDTGRPTYLVDYERIDLHGGDLDLAPWVDDVVPTAVESVSADAGGRPVHLVGWSMGGIFAALGAADRPDLPIGSLTVLGSPFDLASVPMLAPPSPQVPLAGDRRPQGRRLFGDLPGPLLRRTLQLGPVDRLLGRPLAVASHLDDPDYLAQLEAVDRFTASTTAYPGRAFGQLYHRLLGGSEIATGRVVLGGRTVALADLTAPTLVLAGAGDAITPLDAVRAVVPLLEGAREVRLEVVPGGHLGMLTGRAARTSTWPVLTTWLDQVSSP